VKRIIDDELTNHNQLFFSHSSVIDQFIASDF